MKKHTKTDFAGAVQELLGIVVAQILTTALQVRVSPLKTITVPLPLEIKVKVEESRNKDIF